MRRLLPLLLLPLAACGAEPAPAPPPPPTTTEHVRTPQDCTKLTVTAMTVEPGIAYIFGTHAEWLPKGQFIRVRVAITNTDNTFRTTRPSDYHLDDAADRPHPPSVDAMAIKRQPTELTLGAGNRAEVDLWYDIPADTSPKLLRDNTCVTTIALPG
ncbi:DUF4352 domain-containing protein [Nocardia ninae]|uniref:DUF4352 domain-containing protein n=1 Tax=Nocardia ninae NBRC 108245 TaxID=1210091 RepID=A0A511M835_9NOCA|nr:DUF4352 domain-containing protein [Nocardia ninae]GEM36792.1 hypothetical protein NN4_13110 [Nocardia ninae NBRC 108245]